MMKNTPIILTLLCTSLVWCSVPNAMEDDHFVLDTRPGQKLVLTEQGYAKALALQESYDQGNNQRDTSSTELPKSVGDDNVLELSRTLGLSPEELKLAEALHLSFENHPETNPQPSDIPYPLPREKKDNGPSLLNHVREINTAKEQDIKLKKVSEHTELVAQLLDEKGKAWEVYLALIGTDPKIEALEDDEEKTKKRQAREEEKGRASENWSMLLRLHAAAEAELKVLETKEASIGEDSDRELERALSASRQTQEEEQNKIAREIREAKERKEAEEKQQADERRAEAKKMLEEVQEIRRAQKESLLSQINKLREEDNTSDTINSLYEKINAFYSLDNQIHEEIIHLIKGGDPRDLPWKEEVLRILQSGTSSFSSSSLPSIPSSALPNLNNGSSKDSGEDSGSGYTFL